MLSKLQWQPALKYTPALKYMSILPALKYPCRELPALKGAVAGCPQVLAALQLGAWAIEIRALKCLVYPLECVPTTQAMSPVQKSVHLQVCLPSRVLPALKSPSDGGPPASG